MTSPRCYDKQHQHRPGPLTEWTWDEYDSNTPHMACSQLEEPGATYLVRQCLKIADEDTLWLLTSQPGDHDRRIAYDRARHAMPLPADGGASVHLFTHGAVAGHAGPPQAGPAGAGPSLTLLQGQLIFAKESRVTVLLLTGVVLLRDGQAHVYPPVPISDTILSVTLDPFSPGQRRRGSISTPGVRAAGPERREESEETFWWPTSIATFRITRQSCVFSAATARKSLES